ncbi:C5a anaphylatoxin chemotactic receptor 1-like [Erpetoichthys calabaricus]|uniref:C5a anaphylatoxin chemotactic receptor 1-like n=1 Tax=Erpetoichthys calabaricus TaxID=27687 RepID=UPI002233EB6D|nr:C5a anaphylatoxin chemotactic receptor 1-like [Erpetoichthys calabaricus]
MMMALNFSVLEGDYAAEKNSTYQNTKEEVHLNLQAHHFLIAFFHIVILILGVIGNAVVIWIARFKMKSRVSSIWFLNLACADLFCCLCIPFVMYTVVHNQHWPFGFQLCRLVYGIIYISSYCTIFFLTIISLDHFILVVKPVWCKNYRNTHCAILLCLLVWGFSLLLVFPVFIYHNEYKDPLSYKIICAFDFSSFGENMQLVEFGMIIYQFLVGFFFPFLSISACFFFIFWQKRQKREGFGKRSKKTVEVITVVIVTLFVCWFPYHITNFLLGLTSSTFLWRPHQMTIVLFLKTLVYCNSCLSPLVYVCISQECKVHMYKSFRGVMKIFMTNDLPSRSVTTFTTKSSSINDQISHI